MPTRPIRVLIADDHDLMAAAIRRVLAEHEGVEIVGEARAGGEVLPLALATRPDVVLLDVGMPDRDGLECAAAVRKHLPDVRILMLTAYGDPGTVSAAEAAGADGYILKSATAADLFELLAAPAPDGFVLAGFPEPEHARGPVQLTARERSVLAGVCDGLSNRQIGRQLWITEPTVKFHLKNIFRKLGASNRAEVAARGRELGLVWSGERRTTAAS